MIIKFGDQTIHSDFSFQTLVENGVMYVTLDKEGCKGWCTNVEFENGLWNGIGYLKPLSEEFDNILPPSNKLIFISFEKPDQSIDYSQFCYKKHINELS